VPAGMGTEEVGTSTLDGQGGRAYACRHRVNSDRRWARRDGMPIALSQWISFRLDESRHKRVQLHRTCDETDGRNGPLPESAEQEHSLAGIDAFSSWCEHACQRHGVERLAQRSATGYPASRRADWP
jgi:hypothetical protein